MAESSHRPSPFIAVSAIIVSMALAAAASGVMFAYVPIKLAAENFPPWVAGAMITAVAGGGIFGCLITSALVKQAGHARAFMALVALEILCFLAISFGTFPWIWVGARFVYGFAVTGLFIVAQSWMNDATENEWRGRVIALFYMSYVLAVGLGSFALRFLSLEGPGIPLLAVILITLSIFPIASTRLPQPAPPESAAIAFRAVWRISPVGLTGMLCVGGLTMLLQGFGPIYAASEGFGKNDIAWMMFLMQFGMLAVQYPLGAWSDQTDRRIVLMVAAILVVIASAYAGLFTPQSLIMLILVFAIWSGANESIYALANAHANDRADQQYYVSLSSTLLIGWSIAGFIIPGVTTMLTPFGGPKTFMFLSMMLALIYGLFVAVRYLKTEPVPDEDSEAYIPMTGQMPYGAELVAGEADPELEQVKPDVDQLSELDAQASEILGMEERKE